MCRSSIILYALHIIWGGMWGKLDGSVAALSNIKGLVANFAFRVSSIYVFIRISSRRVMNFRFLLIY
ncbi:hypothetical protein C5S29_12005 [ANME-1 cluster archaeon GoMg3.2]|nr:hypothetical protein [ANME-1 cluster archaeon GoMg3.2]